MDSKKKFIIALCSVAVVILASILITVAVLAAQTVTVKNSINITYQADPHVKCKVTGAWRMKNGTSGNLNVTEFNGFEEGASSNKDGGGIPKMSFTRESNDYIEISFTFLNNSTNSNYIATLTLKNGTINNVNVEGAKGLETLADIKNSLTNAGQSINIPVGTSVTYKIKISLADAYNDAVIAGDLFWNIVGTRAD